MGLGGCHSFPFFNNHNAQRSMCYVIKSVENGSAFFVNQLKHLSLLVKMRFIRLPFLLH